VSAHGSPNGLNPAPFLAIWSTNPQEVELGYHQHIGCLDGDYFSMIQTPFHSSAGGSA
jgi:hypothetical protein